MISSGRVTARKSERKDQPNYFLMAQIVAPGEKVTPGKVGLYPENGGRPAVWDA